MKISFKKVTSVLACTALLGATLGFAAAVDNYPAPFVTTSGQDVAVVYGANSLDYTAALTVGQSLSSALPATASADIGSEAKAVETSGQKLYLGDYMNNTKEAMTKTDLPVLLADGKIVGSDGVTYDYNQKIGVPNSYISYGKTVDNLASPVLNAYFETTSQLYNEQIIFPTAVNMANFTNKDITLFGKKYTFTGSAADLTTTKIVLFENSQGQTIKEGESATVTVGSTPYEIALQAVGSDSTATITVGSASENVVKGGSYKVGGLDLYVKNVINQNYAGGIRSIEIYAGSAKVTLQDGTYVIKGSTNVYGTSVGMTSSGGKVTKIAINVTPYSLDNRVSYVKEGGALTDPVFGSFKMTFKGITPALEDTSRDVIEVKTSGEQKGHLKFTNQAGSTYDLDLFKPSDITVNTTNVANYTLGGAGNGHETNADFLYNTTTMGFDTYYVITSATEKALSALPSAVARERDLVVTTNGKYSQIWEVVRIDVSNGRITLRDKGSSGGDAALSLSSHDVGATADLALSDGSTATVTLTGNASVANVGPNVTVSKASPLVYTKGGALINLTIMADPSKYNQTKMDGTIQVVEETAYNGGDFKNNAGTTLGTGPINISTRYARATRSGNDLEISSVSVPGASAIRVGDYDDYYVDAYGAYIRNIGNYDKVTTLLYPTEAANYGFYVGSTTPGGAGGIVPVTDVEAASVSSNLIVVGGSCINSVAAELLGGALCGDDFTTATGVGAGEFLIKTFSRSGKVATVVAGYEMTDTTAAVNALVAQKPAIAAGTGFKGDSTGTLTPM
ncbi:MAG: hypothetical protein WC796_00515 [Candidatus Pacearchaeota archaeon]